MILLSVVQLEIDVLVAIGASLAPFVFVSVLEPFFVNDLHE